MLPQLAPADALHERRAAHRVVRLGVRPVGHGDGRPEHQPQQLARLQLSARRATKGLTASFGWTGADAFTQHDVQELTVQLFDALERSDAAYPRRHRRRRGRKVEKIRPAALPEDEEKRSEEEKKKVVELARRKPAVKKRRRRYS